MIRHGNYLRNKRKLLVTVELCSHSDSMDSHRSVVKYVSNRAKTFLCVIWQFPVLYFLRIFSLDWWLSLLICANGLNHVF